MNEFESNFLTSNGFTQSISVTRLMDEKNAKQSLPDEKGLYILALKTPMKRAFLETGTGGHFEGKDPNVSTDKLEERWVEGSQIFYIGQAGGFIKGNPVKSTLYTRIDDLIRFGNNHGAPHSGGRYLWQLAFSRELFVYYRICPGIENPRETEKMLIKEYKNHYGKRPFANINK